MSFLLCLKKKTEKKANNKYTTQPYRLAAQMFPGASHLSW
ncbi:hypothetical protein AD15_0453 [Escherichia coli 3-105-05_S4_C2]|nr:hypothetical protein AD15_0453 [Escherichia coli 3-105-05_S4_C2]